MDRFQEIKLGLSLKENPNKCKSANYFWSLDKLIKKIKFDYV